jgi:hypothetical protein
MPDVSDNVRFLHDYALELRQIVAVASELTEAIPSNAVLHQHR